MAFLFSSSMDFLLSILHMWSFPIYFFYISIFIQFLILYEFSFWLNRYSCSRRSCGCDVSFESADSYFWYERMSVEHTSVYRTLFSDGECIFYAFCFFSFTFLLEKCKNSRKNSSILAIPEGSVVPYCSCILPGSRYQFDHDVFCLWFFWDEYARIFCRFCISHLDLSGYTFSSATQWSALVYIFWYDRLDRDFTLYDGMVSYR